VGAVQHDICWEDPHATFEHLAPMIRSAVAGGASLVVLSEMFSTGFSMAAERVAEPVGGPSGSFLVDQARRHGVHVCASVPTIGPGGSLAVNRLVLAGPDGTVHHYDKIHPFSHSGEHEHYAAGDAFLTVTVEGVRCSFFVCYDLRFADEFWALATDTDCYVVVANWPAVRRHHWRGLLVARAIENQAYVVGANRVGVDGNGVEYAGDSLVVDPTGEVVASAARVETVVSADVDPAAVAALRTRFPFIADRRRR
jgi:predicted amidohydrolase